LEANSRITDDDYIKGAPELVAEIAASSATAEIAASSATYDLYDTKKAYKRNRIQEYIVWQSLENKLGWFQLHDSEYISLQTDVDGIIRS
jgi:Uma2 family endonuclease